MACEIDFDWHEHLISEKHAWVAICQFSVFKVVISTGRHMTEKQMDYIVVSKRIKCGISIF